MTNKHKEKILDAYKSGQINKYMLKRLLDATSSGVDDVLCDELIEDAKDASSAGVHSDEEYNSYFYAGHFTDDILDETFGISVDPAKKKDLSNYIAKLMDDDTSDYAKDNLIDYQLLVHKWLCDKIDKKAYPNIGGVSHQMPQYNIDKWIDTLKNIYSSLREKQISKTDAVNRATFDWDTDEKYDFIQWMKYFEEGTPEKYDVKIAGLTKQAIGNDLPTLPSSWYANDRGTKPDLTTYKEQKQNERNQKAEQAKNLKVKMRSRLRSLKRLIEQYCDILTTQNIDQIYDEMYALDKSINKLNIHASITDRIIRSANKLERLGFKEGSDLLKTAVEPNKGEFHDEEVLEALPPGVDPKPSITVDRKQHIDTIIDRLAGVSKKLKSRDTIRELASIDILLNDVGLASYFPELTDAQAKLIEAYGYASNKVEAIIAKLRGTGTTTHHSTTAPVGQQQAPAPAKPIMGPEKIEKNDIMEKPVGEVKRVLPKEKK